MSIDIFAQKLQSVVESKKTSVYLPIAKRNAVVAPLTVADDINLRTQLVDIKQQFQTITDLLYKKTTFDPPYKDYNEYTSHITSFDLEALAWGLYKSTYNTIKSLSLTCTHCGHNYTSDIEPTALLHEDSFTEWDKEVPFTEYTKQLELKLTDSLTLEVDIKLPSLRRVLFVLSSIPDERATKYLESFGYTVTDYEFLLMCIHKMVLKENGEPIADTSSIQEIQFILNTYIDVNVKDTILNTYDEEFNKYTPKFYFDALCPACQKTYRVDIPSMITVFFLRLLGV